MNSTIFLLFAGYYRAEEIQLEETNLEGDELLVQVAHFHKEPRSTFGIPFLMKVCVNAG